MTKSELCEDGVSVAPLRHYLKIASMLDTVSWHSSGCWVKGILVCREFVEHVWPKFTEQNPQIPAEAVIRAGKHPYLEAKYSKWWLNWVMMVQAPIHGLLHSRKPLAVTPTVCVSGVAAVCGNERTIDLRNSSPEEILRQAVLLRSSLGRKASLQVKKRVVTSQSSIQGRWNGELQQQLKAQ